ncbi:crossover junction endodeoxyribonuclease RuvC [Clostridium felsineum]|uniref:crossover junction endodeoxyribonuclease RuvC n=1 Tax=Clostridium felsineum TaxID=36839 RepID=UPI00098C71D5|nr:crossover junction endodeoxyribonuclease RuvC [Clostridium felsineum]URZ16909.1 Crossover junction endodeoxyribonuclease RuvC [Clostridium felsineum DSM 794]
MAGKGKKKQIKRILAMDLSMNLPGFAVLDIANGKVVIRETSYVDNKTGDKVKLSYAEKLNRIAMEMARIFTDYPDIDAVVREKGFYRFAGITQVLFRVVGVSDLLVYQHTGVTTIDELPPTTVKRIVAGDGRADKKDVEVGVREHLTPMQKDYTFYSDDVSDAVAVGIAWFLKHGYID